MKKLAALFLAGVLAASLAACGGASSSAPAAAEETAEAVEETAAAEETAEAAEEPAAEETAEAAAEEPAEETAEAPAEEMAVSPAIADGVLTIGTNATFPPFEFIGDDGNPDGFDMALIKAIGEKLGVEVEIQDMEFDSLVASIGTKIDASIAGMTITEERKNAVDFSEPYYDATQYILAPVDTTIATVEDLAASKMGAQLGTTGELIASELNEANTVAYNTFNQAVSDLLNGKVDCVVIDKEPANSFAAQYEGKFTVIDGSQFDFAVEQYGIAMPKGDTALVDAVNAALAELREDGTFEALLEEYMNGAE